MAMTEQPKEALAVTEEELEVLRQVRSIRAGNAGPAGGMAFQQAIAEIIQGCGGGQRAAEAPRSPGTQAVPQARPAPATPQGQPPGSS
eukprot:3066063-Heterocapsa_arctica.AAC.1